MNKKLIIGAALMGGTFAFMSPVIADVPVVQSQADHVATSAGAVPLNRQQEVNSADSALMESVLFQLQDLQSLVAEQRGIIEELSYQVQVLQQEQKERYVDLDKRIQLLQGKVASGVAPSASLTNEAQTALSDEEILAEYNSAKALMLEKKFDESISQLAIFAKKHPQHPLTPNAWYWIGEIYMVQRNSNEAKAAFERIVNDYSDHEKVPDSLYKLGVIAQQSSDVSTAKAYFERVLSDFPNSQSAKLSKARLNSN
jgi:tol-pal system protein YbgF